MEVAGKRYIIYGSRKDEFTIWNLADLHLWNSASDLKAIKRDIKNIEDDPFSFWLGGGDYADYIGYTDKRFDPDAIAENVLVSQLGKMGMAQMQEVKELFNPIKHKCLGLVLGNHEKKYQITKEQSNLHAWLCTELEVSNLEYSAIFDLVFCRTSRTKHPYMLYTVKGKHLRSESFRIYVHHGSGYAQTKGGKLNKLIQFMHAFEADIYFVAHVHDQTGTRLVTLGANAPATELIQKEKLGVISGSYLKTYAEKTTSYGEQKGYLPTILGAAKVTIKPNTREVRGEI